MDTAQFIEYTFEDFVEDKRFWKWVLKEDDSHDSFWRSLQFEKPETKQIMEKAQEHILHLNSERYKLSESRVATLWERIQASKNKR
ncbi:hypothetical protein [Pontibacter harenae]|uniref:hypothetical protein n=1 Tax=Pontibacter harenae TaxID=2894083 RepID=UPI001E5E1678|nr:hypothetical protein [Pontibacter harenae]